MELVHRVVQLDPEGGRYGLGLIRAEADIHPEDWFITCHFIDDQVMPGTLMYECCLHTLRVFLLRLGWVGVEGEVVAQPVPGVCSRLKCRGQVLGSTQVVTYEVSIKELGYRPEPYAIVDALMYADGKPIVDIGDMSLRLSGLDRDGLEAMWEQARQAHAARQHHVPSDASLIPFDRRQLQAFAGGDPSKAFGAHYAPFDRDQPRQCARLPRAPFLMVDRVVAAGPKPRHLAAGAWCEAEVDLTGFDWYFTGNRQQAIPLAVLLEMSLQACGWLAAYAGSALVSDDDLRFRNLGGEATLRAPVLAGSPDTLRTRAELVSVSRSAGMIIQRFAFRTWSIATGQTVYEGTTSFGFFSAQALANQVGLGPFTPRVEEGRAFPVPHHAPMPNAVMRMVDHIDRYVPDGGEAGLGTILGSIAVDREAWFFRAHFFEDPVWPGSLGLEAFVQLLKVMAIDRWGLGPEAQFATAPLGLSHRWTYRGQIVPAARRVEV
ncbi:MAG: type I polyketide synthase, partial [Myxococcota bacterium]